jgi:hypothetical protein
MYKYDEKSRQGKAGFGYYISAVSVVVRDENERERVREREGVSERMRERQREILARRNR